MAINLTKPSERKPDTLTRYHKLFLEAYSNTLGNVAESCRQVKINRSTYYDWYSNSNVFKEAIEEANESFLDMAETKLKENVKAGKESSIAYYLNNKGQGRGYKRPDTVATPPVAVDLAKLIADAVSKAGRNDG